MSYCWYCYWGWAKPAADIYEEAVRRLGGDSHYLHYGPAHIVWEDENWDCVEWCLDNFDSWVKDVAPNMGTDYTPSKEQYEVVRWSLLELQKIPLEELEVEPEDYDGENPKLFPPNVEVRRV